MYNNIELRALAFQSDTTVLIYLSNSCVRQLIIEQLQCDNSQLSKY